MEDADDDHVGLKRSSRYDATSDDLLQVWGAFY